jgi:hypothetical protein
MMEMRQSIKNRKMSQAAELSSRLERISVDSYWAHRAGGLRVALLRHLDQLNANTGEVSPADAEALDALIEHGYWILENAAKGLWGKTY